MNLVGKILVVLILVMSLVFMGFAVAVYATHKNWKDEIERTEAAQGKPKGYKALLNDEIAKNKELAEQNAALKKEIETVENDRRLRVTNLATELATRTQERDQLQNDAADLKQGEREAVQANKAAQAMLDAKLAEIDKLRADLFEAYKQRDAKFKDSVALTDQVIEKEAEVERLKENKLSLLKTMSQLKIAAHKAGVDINKPADLVPPKVEGIVLASRANGLVEISVGSDDGLIKGHEAYIYRNKGGDSKFVAKIEIVETTPDRSVGKVIPSFKKSPIMRDDNVVTRLP
jgi:chromosome segregation ATPase